MKGKNLVVTATDVRGHCNAGIEVGDKFVLEGANISLEKSNKICGIAFASIYPILFAARCGVDLEGSGLRGVQCLDPGPSSGGDGTVIFKIEEYKGS
jgi:uncharacterized repeat protein (TIGR04076 family)